MSAAMARQARELTSWGRVKRGLHIAAPLHSRHDAFPVMDLEGSSILAIGNGRSYGDCGLNVGAGALLARGLDRFISFDVETGVLRCEAGVLLDEILKLAVPRGWFLQVTPGTRFVTVGGAIANDVHGKNHHVAGTFGCHLRCFELLRSDNTRLTCSTSENPDWFAASIGGLGLTGIITWAELALRRIAGPLLDTESMRFSSLDEFMSLSDESDASHEYTVAWIDCTGSGAKPGRGIFMRGRHADGNARNRAAPGRRLRVPFTPPLSLVNALSVRVFNQIYYHRHPARVVAAVQHYEPFFYPLDGILEWNRIYGAAGFHQYQCVIPEAAGAQPVEDMLMEIRRARMGSFLAVLKRFGTPPSPGLLSFPRPGLTLALDFPEAGPRLHSLFDRLDQIVAAAGGRLYPAKDSRMPARLFRAGYPQLDQFMAYKDPRLSSGFWRRMMEEA